MAKSDTRTIAMINGTNITEYIKDIEIKPNGSDGVWLFRCTDGSVVEVYSPRATEYFHTPGCACHPVYIWELGCLLVGGQDDCPVHGLGA